MSDAIAALVARLDRALAAKRPDYYAELLPGAADEVLAAFESRFAVGLPQALRALYRWRDGQPRMSFEMLHDNWGFSSLKDVATSKELLDGMIGFDFTDPRWWRKEWVPFLSNGNGDHLCADPLAQDGGTPGQVIVFWHDRESRSRRYDSVEQWLTEVVRRTEQRTWDDGDDHEAESR